MDAPITEIRGSVEKNVLTLTLPGRRNIEGASTFTKKEKRIATVKAVPRDGGVELVLTFKDSPPPFFAKANGKVLEVDFGETPKPGADDGVAEGKKGKKKHKAIAKKKDAKGKKKHKKSDD